MELNFKFKFNQEIVLSIGSQLNLETISSRFPTQTTQTAYLLSQGGLHRPIVDPAQHATFLR